LLRITAKAQTSLSKQYQHIHMTIQSKKNQKTFTHDSKSTFLYL